MRQHTFVIQHALNQHLNFAAAGFTAIDARRDHPGIIEHQQIARIELIQHISKHAMVQRPARAIQRQQAATAALRLRIVGDQRFR